GARDNYRKGIETLEKVKPVASSSPEVCDELARGYQNLAFLQPKLSPPVSAESSWDRLLAIRQELAKAFPESLNKQTDLVNVHLELANRLKQRNKNAEAIANYKYAATIIARYIGVVEKDTARSEQDRKELTKSLADNTLQILQLAIGAGFSDVN